MVQNHFVGRLRKLSRSTSLIIQAAVVAVAMLLPMLGSQASAAQLTARSVTATRSTVSSTAVQLTFAYTPPANTTLGIKYEFCTTPLGTCTAPTGTGATWKGTQVSQTIPGIAFTISSADTGGCLAVANIAYTTCASRASGSANSGSTNYNHVLNGFVFPNAKQTVYVRIQMYTGAGFTTPSDNGNVAFAITDSLLVTGRVQERLDFCVASLDAAAALPANVPACVLLASTGIDIGVIDNSTLTAVSPVLGANGNGADNKYGILMTNTNAVNGTSISYYPESNPGATNQVRSFRQNASTCSVTTTSTTDSCFISSATTGAVLVVGTESFGMQIPCIDRAAGATTTNFQTGTVPTAYSNTDNTYTASAGCQNLSGGDTGIKFAWDDTGTPATIATSAVGPIDNEIIKVRFGAEAAATTPVGNYTVSTSFIAAPIF